MKTKKFFQFFGWFRVMCFGIVLLGTMVFVTFTKELPESHSLSSMFSSNLLVFVLAYFVINVGYDVLRELVGLEYQQYDTDNVRFYLLTLFLFYFMINNNAMTDNLDKD